MSSVEDHAQLASDAELITRVRAGDRSAFGDLYSRHAGAAAALARQFSRSAAEADDLVSEAFARVLDGLLSGKGPDTAFRAYLFTTLRNTAYDRTRKDKRLQFTDDIESHDVALEGDDPVIADLESGLVGKAFASLPERWQTVLWHTQVEGQSAAEVGVLLGMAPNAVTSLAFRAREGLREAYLQAHLAETADNSCQTTVNRLGAWARGGLSKREKAQVDAHLETCDRCRALAAELTEINSSLRGLLAPLLLGGAAVGYVSTLGPVAPLAQLGVLSGGAAVSGKAVGSQALGGAAKASWTPGAVVAGIAAVAAVAVAGVVIALTVHKSSPPLASGGGSSATAVTATGNGGANGGNGGGGTGANGTGQTAPGAAAGGSATNGASGSNGAAGASGATGTQSAQGGFFGSPTVQSTPTDALTSISAPTNDSTGDQSSDVPATDTATTDLPTTDLPTTSEPTTGQPTTGPPTTGPPTTGTPTTGTPTTGPPTTPPSPPDVVVDPGSAVSGGITAGGVGTLTVKIGNTGGTASPAGQSVVVTAPTGFEVGLPALAQGLRRSMIALAATGSATCTAGAESMSCTLPAIAASSTLTLSFPLTTTPGAASGSIGVSIDGVAAAPIPVTVSSGYLSAVVGSDNELALAAVNTVGFQATPEPGATNVGSLSLPVVLAPGMTIVGVVPAAPGAPSCVIAGGKLTCPFEAVTAGVQLAVQVAADAATDVTAPAQDEGGRSLSTGALTVAGNPAGGYDAASLAGPTTALRPGSTITVTLAGTVLNPGVFNPGPITVPLQLSAGLTVTAVPAGCVSSAQVVTCTPTDGQLPTFALRVTVAIDADPVQTLGTATVPTGAVLPLTPAPGTTLDVDPALSGYLSITMTTDALLAGTTTPLTIVGVPALDVSNPGLVTVPNDLGGGVSIVAAASPACTVGVSTTVCTPATDGTSTSWPLTVAVVANAQQGTLQLPMAALPGGRTLPLTADPGADLTTRAAATAACPSRVVALGNGDFEAPVVQPGAGRTINSGVPGQSVTVWQTTATDNLIEFWRNGGNVQSANNNVPIAAQSGAQWVELNANQQSSLYQDLPTTPGEQMRWSIWHRARATSVPNGQDVMQVQIGRPANVVPAVPTGQTGPDISTGPAAWVKYTGTYVVPAGQPTTRFQFAAVRTSSGSITVGNFLDNISFATVPCLTTTTAVTTPDGTTNPGNRLHYTVTVRNDGGDGAAGVTLTDLLPTNTGYVSGSLAINGQPADESGAAGGLVTARLGPPTGPDGAHVLAPDTVSTVTFDVVIGVGVTPNIRISNNAQVTYTWSPSTTPLTSISNTVISP